MDIQAESHGKVAAVAGCAERSTSPVPSVVQTSLESLRTKYIPVGPTLAHETNEPKVPEEND